MQQGENPDQGIVSEAEQGVYRHRFCLKPTEPFFREYRYG